MFHQLLTPLGSSLPLNCALAALPIATVLLLLAGLRRAAWLASLGGLVVGAVIALGPWQFPPLLALQSVAAGATFALWPVMWIVVNALLLYNIAVAGGQFEAFCHWMLSYLPDDRRVLLIVVGFCFGALLEGVAGFGAPVAITTALLVRFGFRAREALTYTLIFNTAPVAFGALGAPIATLGAVTHLPDTTLAAMIGRQLPLIAIVLPFYAIALQGGRRSLRALWPVLAVAGASFAVTQFAVSNYLSYALTDVLASLGSLLLTLAFLRVWRPRPDPQYRIDAAALSEYHAARVSAWRGWMPWVCVSAVVIAWTMLHISRLGEHKIPWPHLHERVYITLYHTPYAAVWSFQPLATGTAILCACVLTALLGRLPAAKFAHAIAVTWRQSRLTVLTVAAIMGLAYLMNYSGLNYTLGLGVASAGLAFPLLSAFLGWIAVFLSGSDTAGNALFGNLQVVAAHQLGLNPVLIAATNSSGGVLGKMVSPQNLATGASVTDQQGKEGSVLATTLGHSILLTLLLGAIVLVQQYLLPQMIPH